MIRFAIRCIIAVLAMLALSADLEARPPVQWQTHQAVCQPGDHAVCASSQPAPPQWVCFVTSTKDPQCGTIGWASRKLEASSAAAVLCVSECGHCTLDYCEPLGTLARRR